MSNIWIGEEYSIMKWIAGSYTHDEGVEFEFSMCVDDDDTILDITFVDNIPENRNEVEEEIRNYYNQKL